MGIQIISTGSYLPEKKVSNDDLASFLDTSDEWIFSRTGIKYRHIATEDTTTTMGVKAAQIALERSHLSPEDINLVICVTVTPDACSPMVAATIKKELGIERAATFDMNANCSSFVYGMAIAYSMMKTFRYKNALIIGSDTVSQITDWTDRASCVLFGDGAGAVILQENDSKGILSAYLDCQIDKDNALFCKNKIDPTPFSDRKLDGSDTKIKMYGQGVMRFAVQAFSDMVNSVVKDANININDIKLIIPHQANLRILLSAAKNMDIGADKFYINIEETANTSSATIPIALDWALRDKKINRGDLILFVAFGGGLSSGAVLAEF